MTTDRQTDGTERLQQPVRLIAAHEIAQAEREASSARALVDGNEFADLNPQERIRYRAIHQAFYELVEIQGVAEEEAEIVLELFTENAEIANATLKRVEMNGDWGAADPFERDLLGVLYDAGYKSMVRLPRESPEAKIGIIIPAGFTKEDGFVALRRKRRLIAADHIDGDQAVRPQIEVDKISTFALDIKKLADLSGEAVAEVRLIVAMTMFNAIDWSVLGRHRSDVDDMSEDDHQELLLSDAKRQFWRNAPMPIGRASAAAFNDAMHLARAMHEYGMSAEELRRRLYEVENPSELHSTTGKTFIAEAIHARSDLLTPAATTYYVHS